MDKNELYRLLVTKEAEFEKAKQKRAIKTILAFAIVFFLLLCLDEKPSGIEYVWAAFVAIIMAVIHLLVNAPIFHYLVLQGEAERKYLEELRRQLSEL